jgi:hypothetical protein
MNSKESKINCMVTMASDEKEYRNEERKFSFCSAYYNDVIVKEIQEDCSFSLKDKSKNHPFFENHKNVISELLNCFGVSNKYYNSTQPDHYCCVSNLPVISVPDDVKIPRLRTLDLLTNCYESLEIQILDHKYNSKTFSVTWPHLLDEKKLESKRTDELAYGYNYQKNEPYFYPSLIIAIILRLLKDNSKDTTLLIDDKSYVDNLYVSFGRYPILEIKVYLHHKSKESDYEFENKMNEITLSSVLYKSKIDSTSSPNVDKRLSTLDQKLPSGWIVHGINYHAEKIIPTKSSYKTKNKNIQADLSFGPNPSKDMSLNSHIKTHQILYKDVKLATQKLNDLIKSPERFFDFVNLPASDNTHWSFPSEYEPLQITRFNQNIHHWIVNESMHIYPTKQVFVNDLEVDDIVYPVNDNEWSIYIGSQSQNSPIFLDNNPKDLVENNYLHPSFNVKTKDTKGFYFVYRFIHIEKDHLRLYDVGVTVDVIDPNDELIKIPVGKDFPLAQESLANIVKNMETGFQKKLNLYGYLQLPDKHQNPEYWVWTAKKVYPQKLDKKSQKLKTLTDTPFYTITGYLNGVSRY